MLCSLQLVAAVAAAGTDQGVRLLHAEQLLVASHLATAIRSAAAAVLSEVSHKDHQLAAANLISISDAAADSRHGVYTTGSLGAAC